MKLVGCENVFITYNIFEWIGDSCIASWGNTYGIIFENYENEDVAQKGADGTNGQQPRHNEISYNFAHDLGIWEKQSSFYFQSISCCNNIFNNIVFNIPRAAYYLMMDLVVIIQFIRIYCLIHVKNHQIMVCYSIITNNKSIQR